MIATRKPNAYYWALRCIVAVAAGGLVGFAVLSASASWALELSDSLFDMGALLAVGIAVYCMARTYLSLGEDPGLDDAERARLRRSILFGGPVGAIEVFLHYRRLERK